jgi:hypothetical protein
MIGSWQWIWFRGERTPFKSIEAAIEAKNVAHPYVPVRPWFTVYFSPFPAHFIIFLPNRSYSSTLTTCKIPSLDTSPQLEWRSTKHGSLDRQQRRDVDGRGSSHPVLQDVASLMADSLSAGRSFAIGSNISFCSADAGRFSPGAPSCDDGTAGDRNCPRAYPRKTICGSYMLKQLTPEVIGRTQTPIRRPWYSCRDLGEQRSVCTAIGRPSSLLGVPEPRVPRGPSGYAAAAVSNTVYRTEEGLFVSVSRGLPKGFKHTKFVRDGYRLRAES